MVYLISTLLLLLMLIGKIYFVSIEGIKNLDILKLAPIIILAGLFLLGTASYIREDFARRKSAYGQRFVNNRLGQTFSVLCLLVIGLSFYLNLNKKILTWDSVALYDARAKFLLSGISFSQMVDLSRYDPLNSYYYVLYPPYTSVIHYFWYKLGIPAPTGIYYSSLFLLFGFSVYLFTKKRFGPAVAAFLCFVTISNPVVFSSSLLEYTNIPFTLQFFLGIFLLAEFLEDRQIWKYFFGSALVVTSQWIRFLEPLWLAVVIAFILASFKEKTRFRKYTLPLFLGFYSFIEFASWQSFVSSFGEKTRIVTFSFLRLLEPFVGVFTGSALQILLVFVKYWGIILLVYLYAVFGTFRFFGGGKKGFLQIVLLLSVLIYYSGLYFVSFQSDWWTKLGDSLTRSSIFMIPIAGYIIFSFFLNNKNDEK